MKNLIEYMMEDFVIMTKVMKSDGEGGYYTAWEDGATISAVVSHDSSIQALRAEHEGVTSVYTVTTTRSITLDYHTVLKRVSDGRYFRTTSNPHDVVSPSLVGTLDIAQVKAEAYELT